jgi:hypothetical protein
VDGGVAMPVKINGATSGSVTLAAPATGTDVTLTLPASSGTVATTAYADGSGLVKITDATLASVNSVSVNSCFSATYENYMIVLSGSAISASNNILMRLRSGTTDNTGNDYIWHDVYSATGLTASSFQSSAATGDTSWAVGQINSTYPTATLSVIQITKPFATGHTAAVISSVFADQFSSNQRSFMYPFVATMEVTTSYDGFTLFAAGSATMSGTVRVYGYRN